MKRVMGRGALPLVLALLVCLPLRAAEPQRENSPAQRALSRLTQAAGQTPRVSWTRGRSTPQRVGGFRYSTGEKDARTAARRFLEEFPELVAVAAGTLDEGRVSRTRTRTVVRYRQLHEGLPVLDAEVIVALDEEQRVVSLASSARAVSLAEDAPDMGADAAAAAAVAAVLGRTPSAEAARRYAPMARKAVLAAPGGARLVYRVVVPSVPLLEKWVCIVDGATGQVLRKRNEVVR